LENVIVKYNHTPKQVVTQIKKLIYEGVNNPTIKEISFEASKIQNTLTQDKYIFDKVYNLAVFKPSPNDRQQLRTVENIIRTKYANCTGYATLLGSIFENLKKPYTLRLVDMDNTGFSHIYIKTKNAVLDCILNQKQDGTQTFQGRKEGLFNYEVNYKNKNDYPMITTINGRISTNRLRNKTQINGFWDTLLTPLLGDECNLECNMKYASDEEMRKLCKEACAMNMTISQYNAWLSGGGTVASLPYVSNPNEMSKDTKTMLYVGAGALAVYLLTKKK